MNKLHLVYFLHGKAFKNNACFPLSIRYCKIRNLVIGFPCLVLNEKSSPTHSCCDLYYGFA